MSIVRKDFGISSDGKSVSLYTLTNRTGASIQMTNFGAIIVSINVPDASGRIANVNAGFDNLDDYLKGHPKFGATVGRFANRIAKGKFSIGPDEYTLFINNGPNHLHGGKIGFDKKVWTVQDSSDANSDSLRFELFSPDGDEGYPGNLHVYATYSWDNANRLTIRYEATTDRETHVNLTNHAYFNLSGIGSGSITKHELQLSCSKFLEVDDGLIPTGKLNSVVGTPFDFTSQKAIGLDIAALPATKGYDHCLVIDGKPGELRLAANVADPKSKRAMEVMTTQPGVQLYTGNNLSSNDRSAGLKPHEVLCLETQHFPDSPNRPEFPSTLLIPGDTYLETATYRFYVAG